jgi:glycosyltransferase involved in cell wall biosynthesis
MKICMLTSSYPKYPGETTAPFIEEIAAGLVRRGHTVHMIAPYHPEVQRAPVERGIHLHFFKYSPVPALNVWGYAQSLRADVGLRGAALIAAPLALMSSMASLFAVTGNPKKYSPSDDGKPFDIVHAHWVLPNGPPASMIARLRGLPLVISMHGSDVFLAERAVPLSLSAAQAYHSALGITACSGDLRSRAIRIGAPAERVQVIPYGVNPQEFQPDPEAGAIVRKQLGLGPEHQLIVTLSRLVYKKGLSFLIDAMPAVLAQHPNARLVIVGYGDLRDELEQQAIALGLGDKVLFPGQADREQAARYIAAADIYAVPSIRDQNGNVDGLPNSLLEGMGVGRPIVASAIAGIPEVIDNEVHGLLTPERDSQALAVAVNRILGDPAFAERMGQAARQRILHELTWDNTAERFEQVYQATLERAAKA